ncbi:NUDIX hydrolase [Indiicoccus explosivorum]|uniref:NUDIX hydrolase n=1 Tax=Indiicoccus explosivorum TaxID=1917864 RepID=UPI000B42D88D|nr:CoA pyrophosphatase [Indiicoccus explosivorum]
MKPKKFLDRVKEHTPSVLGHEDFAKYAVLLPLIEKNGETHVVFEVRSYSLRRQPGEICFPGGRIDRADEDAKETALRETEEELGISPAEISDVHSLDYLVSPFGMMVYAFAGEISAEAELELNKAEVDHVFTVPLSFFFSTPPKVYRIGFSVQPEPDFPFDLITGGEEYDWRTRHMEEYFYSYGDKVIWGLTARILAHFISVVK